MEVIVIINNKNKKKDSKITILILLSEYDNTIKNDDGGDVLLHGNLPCRFRPFLFR